MNYLLKRGSLAEDVSIELPFSKSISNRLLIAQALSNFAFDIRDLSEAEDTDLLKMALSNNTNDINVGMAGTAFRFLTAYFAIKSENVNLTGAKRMKERPIGELVDQLRLMGAQIDYLENEGYPPLNIQGKELEGGLIHIDASISSQYVTALMLIAPYLKNGLQIHLEGEIVSLPYIDITISLMRLLNVVVHRDDRLISIEAGAYESLNKVYVERDWSSAAFIYQMVALSGNACKIEGLQKNSIQGDKLCSEIFESLGVETRFDSDGIQLMPKNIPNDTLQLDLRACPDLIPSVIITASQKLKELTIKGVSTLRIKESNRVKALQNELAKIGTIVEEIGGDELKVISSKSNLDGFQFKTYNDHRIAMCLAPLVLSSDSITIENPVVVGKSFPGYWEQFKKFNIRIQSSN